MGRIGFVCFFVIYGFFSKKLSKSEVNYSTFDRELLAAVAGIKHFRTRLEGRPFELWTDHKPLIFALHRVSPPTSGRQQRHLAFISEYTNQLRYLPGTTNVVADALSRPATAAVAAGTERVCAAIADKAQLRRTETAVTYPQRKTIVKPLKRLVFLAPAFNLRLTRQRPNRAPAHLFIFMKCRP